MAYRREHGGGAHLSLPPTGRRRYVCLPGDSIWRLRRTFAGRSQLAPTLCAHIVPQTLPLFFEPAKLNMYRLLLLQVLYSLGRAMQRNVRAVTPIALVGLGYCGTTRVADYSPSRGRATA